MAGTDIPEKEVVSILHRLGFEAEYADDGRMKVGIPPHRSRQDIAIPADIAEEVLRIHGYDKIKPRLPEAPLEPLFVNKPLRMEHRARRLLAASHGFIEVHNYGWTDEAWVRKIGFQPQRALELRNPSTQHTQWLRTTLIPNLLALVPQNRAHRDRFGLFEIGHVYSQADDDRTLEMCNLAAVSFCPTGQPPLEEQFRAIKGAIEDLGQVIRGEPFRFEPSAAGDAPWQTADHWVAVCRGDSHLGGLGVLGGNILKAVAPEGGQVVWFELSMDALEGPIFPDVEYAAPPVYPGSWQDFSLVWDMARGFAALEDRLARFSHPLIMRREFLYAYKGKGLPKGKASYSYRFWLGAWDRTLSSQEIDEFRTAMLEFLQSEEIPLR
jgi:phenylalanyl-tRNA synthetase beta chain